MKEGKMIKTAQGWVVVTDEKDKKIGDSIIGSDKIMIKCNQSNLLSIQEHWKKVIASETKTEGLYPLDRHQIEGQINGWDLEVLAHKSSEKRSLENRDYITGFKDGFNKHAELTKDRENEMFRNFIRENHLSAKWEEYLKRPKSYNVTWEEETFITEVVSNTGAYSFPNKMQPKLTNGFLHIKIVK